jgi:threonylcarbamoyladenosine tRNA methylthiotransferase MtaB
VRVAFRTLGCKVNRVESDAVAAELLGAGASVVAEDEASVIVINTCTVTGEADAKARKAVRHALRAAQAPVVVVTGCLASLDPNGLQALGDRVVVESDKTKVAGRVRELLGIADGGCDSPVVRSGDAFRTRALLKVEDGCDNFCTYCIVPHARGGPRAVPLEHVAAEAKRLVAAGVREIVLTGINIGRYRDEESGADLAALIDTLAATGISRLRLSSIEPPDLDERLLAVLSATPAVCEHLHVPLQSGSDAVLGAMGRTYTAEQYAERIQAARTALPGLAVTTDVIGGFPGETPEQHAETLAFVRRIDFAKLHVFRYSVRTGTPAALMAQLPPAVIAARAAELRTLGDQLRGRFLARRLPATAGVLVESVEGDDATGTTRDYLRVRVLCPGAGVGEVRECALTADDVVGS